LLLPAHMSEREPYTFAHKLLPFLLNHGFYNG
jgi:hypothetical protein